VSAPTCYLELQVMKCPTCRTPMETRRENHRYTASGLANVVLVDVEVRSCPACGESGVVIPHLESLHREIAMSIIKRPGRLTPQEIRVLRKWRGWSGVDFARHMGVDPATVSRWESTESPQPMGPVADRLLRLAVAHGEPAASYPMSTLTTIDAEGDRLALLRMKPSRAGWVEQVPA
jgi:putative zinc finger/helix-turn-helix YgiT family protein